MATISSSEARDILRNAQATTINAQTIQNAAKDSIENLQEAVAKQEETARSLEDVVKCSDSFEAKWKEFQQMFDNLTNVMVDRIGGQFAQNFGPKPRPAEEIDIFRAAQTIRRSRRVVVLTGAGISAESGIPTFRGSDGYWTVGSENYRPQELATWQKYNEMPEELWKWYQYRWGVCRKARANPGHYALVGMESLIDGGYTLVTQNIDGLHKQAGSNPAKLCEIHGRIDEMRCDERIEGACMHGLSLGDPANFDAACATVVKTPEPKKNEQDEQLPRCKKCGVRQRPKILWFDESYNEAFYKYNTVLDAMRGCDLLLIIGTQLSTGLPHRMVSEARDAGAIMIRIDPYLDLQDSGSEGMLHLVGKSGELLPKIVDELRKLRMEEPMLPRPLAITPVNTPPRTPPMRAQSNEHTGERRLGTPPSRANASANGTVVPHGAIRRSVSHTNSAPAAPVGAAAAARRSASRGTVVGSRGLRAAAAASLSSKGGTPASRALSKPAGAASSHDVEPSADLAVGFFVYGSLRPDDDSGQAWTKSFCEGLEAQPATLHGASLYIDNYAAVCFEQTRCKVRGVLLTPAQAKNRAVVMAAKLAEADRIEGYPGLYKRSVREVYVQGAGGKLVARNAYVYHRTGLTDRERCPCVADGDWLSRNRVVSSKRLEVLSE